MLNKKYLFLDVECEGLHEQDDKLHGVAVLRFEGDDPQYLPAWSLPQWFIDDLASPDVIKVIHSGKRFDLIFLQRAGLEINGPIHDTFHLYKALDENGQLGLKPLTEHYRGKDFLKSKRKLDQVCNKAGVKHIGGLCKMDLKDPKHEHFAIIAKYAVEDIENTCFLYFHGKKLLQQKWNSIKKIYGSSGKSPAQHLAEVVFPLDSVLLAIDKRGVKANMNLLNQIRKEKEIERTNLCNRMHKICKSYIEKWEESAYQAAIKGRATPRGKAAVKRKHKASTYCTLFNWDSDKHVAPMIYEHMAVPNQFIKCTTKTGNYSIDKNAVTEMLSGLIKGHKAREFLIVFQEYKKVHKIASTYTGTAKVGIYSKIRNGRLYPKYYQTTKTWRLASSNPNCLSMDTEVLSLNGFVKQDKLNLGDFVAVYKCGKLSWEGITNKWVSSKKTRDLVSIKNQHFNMLMTPNHRVLYKNRKSDNIHITDAIKFPMDAHILHGANSTEGNLEVDEAMLRFLVAVQADSYIAKDCSTLEFKFHKRRKYDRLLLILKNLKFDYVNMITTDNRYKVRVRACKPFVLSILGLKKTFPTLWLTLSEKCRTIMLEELFYWDGLYTRRNQYSSSNEANVDLVQALCCLNGWRAHKRIYMSVSGRPNYQLDITRRNYSNTVNSVHKLQLMNTSVWCIEVPNGNFVARRGSDTFITGNCQNIPRGSVAHKFFIPDTEDHVFFVADYSQIELMCAAHFSQEPKMLELFRLGMDLHKHTAGLLFTKNPENITDEERQVGKTCNFLLIYRGNWKKLQFMLKQDAGLEFDDDKCKFFVTRFFEEYSTLDKYLTDLEWEVRRRRCVYVPETGAIRRVPDIAYGDHLDWNNKKFTGSAEMTARAIEEVQNDRTKKAYARGERPDHDLMPSDETIFWQCYRYFRSARNQAINFPCQHLAMYICGLTMIRLHKEDVDIVNQVHDELKIQMCKADIYKIPWLVNIMENTYTITTKLAAEWDLRTSFSKDDKIKLDDLK